MSKLATVQKRSWPTDSLPGPLLAPISHASPALRIHEWGSHAAGLYASALRMVGLRGRHLSTRGPQKWPPANTPFLLLVQFGECQQLRMVRILRSTLMVRVGGGWTALDEFLVKNDPCRGERLGGCQNPTKQAKQDGCPAASPSPPPASPSGWTRHLRGFLSRSQGKDQPEDQ